jgi:hypothetical protein
VENPRPDTRAERSETASQTNSKKTEANQKPNLSEDPTWNGHWEYHTSTTLEKGVYNQPDRIWTAWFKIPFSDFPEKSAPAPGQTWSFNAARIRLGQHLLWSDGASTTDPDSLGTLEF